LFSSQPEAYPSRRVCAAVSRSSTCDTYNPLSTIYFLQTVQTKDRGTYRCVHVSRKGAKTPRSRLVFLYSSQPEAYQSRRVCAAVSGSTTCDTYNPPSTIYSVRTVQTKDRGTYRCVHVSRKGAKTPRSRLVFLFSSQPKAYQSRRVCVAVRSSTTYDTYNPLSTIYCLRTVQTMDRGTYRCVHVSRKESNGTGRGWGEPGSG
jgi:hypothetical protein